MSEIISDGIGFDSEKIISGVTVCILFPSVSEGRLKFATLDILVERNGTRKSLNLRLPLETTEHCLPFSGGKAVYYVIGCVTL